MTSSSPQMQSQHASRLRGYFDRVDLDDRGDALIVDGWMLTMASGFECFELWVDGSRFATMDRIDRPGVGEAFPFLSHARQSGFRFIGDDPTRNHPELVELKVVGTLPSGEQRQLVTWFDGAAKSHLPIPPAKLMLRTAHNASTYLHICSGLQSYRDFWLRIQRHGTPKPIERLLDWGCGCGRLTAPLLRYSGVPKVHGCDIDPESVAWCREALPAGHFRRVAPYPPTGYADRQFDVVVSNSVFTHLDEDAQSQWLEEVDRILVPGGLFLATVHGWFAAEFSQLHDVLEGLARDGFHDGIRDTTLDGVAPEGYYRATYQTRAYTEARWGRVFEVLEYAVGGSLNFQDLVVLRKQGG